MGLPASIRKRLGATEHELPQGARDRIAELALASEQLARIGDELAAASRGLRAAAQRSGLRTPVARPLYLAAGTLSRCMQRLSEAVMDHAQCQEDVEVLRVQHGPPR
jgi:hypothetical protein